MWCVNTRPPLRPQKTNVLSIVPVTFKRDYKKDPTSFGKIKEAQKKAENQKRKMIDNYFIKYQREKKDLEKIIERDRIAKNAKKKIKKKFTKVSKMPPNPATYYSFAKQVMETHYDHFEHLEPELTHESVEFMWVLHRDDPYYWNPIRLGNLFDCDAVQVRGILWERKLAQEAEKAGDMIHSSEAFTIPWQMLSKKEIKLASKNKIRWEFDDEYLSASVPGKNCYPHQVFFDPPNKEYRRDEYSNYELEFENEPTFPIQKDRDWTREFGFKDSEKKIKYALGRIFGNKEVGKDFRMWPPRERGVSDKRNTWHYIPSGAKSKELLTLIRSYYSKKRVESPRIPPRQIDPPVPLNDYFATGAQKKGIMPGKGKKTLHVDLSSCYSLYDRPMKVRDENNYCRTPTYDERRYFHDLRRYIKQPIDAEQMIIYPDEQQPDHVAVSHKPPNWFLSRVDEEDVDELTDIDNPLKAKLRMMKEDKAKGVDASVVLTEDQIIMRRDEEMRKEKEMGGEMKHIVTTNKRMHMGLRYVGMRRKKEDMLERNRYEHGETMPDEVLGSKPGNPWFDRWWNHIDYDY